MGIMSDLDLTLQAISEVMGEPTETERSQIYIERTVSSVINDLDQLCAFAADPATRRFIEAEKIAIGQIITRAQLVGSLLLASQPTRLRGIN